MAAQQDTSGGRAMGKNFVVLDWESGPWDSTLYIALDDGYGILEYADFTARRSVQGIPGRTGRW